MNDDLKYLYANFLCTSIEQYISIISSVSNISKKYSKMLDFYDNYKIQSKFPITGWKQCIFLRKEEKMKVNIKDLSYSDLYSLYLFVSSKSNLCFGDKFESGKKIVRERLEEIEKELFDRSFGINPYEIDERK